MGGPIACTWQLSRQCAAHCLICDLQVDHAADEQGSDLAFRVLGKLDALGALILRIGGGEPLLRADLPALVERAARRHFVEVTTHGALVSSDKVRRLWHAGLRRFNVILHDADPARHDKASGVPGSHERAQEAWRIALEQRTLESQSVNVVVRLAGPDLGPLEQLLERVAAKGATLAVEPDGGPLAENDGVDCDGLGDRLLVLKSRYPALRNSPSFLARVETALTHGVPGCLTGRVSLHVDHLGRVSRCAERHTTADWVGDLTQDEPAELQRRLRQVQQSEACQRCWRTARGETEELYTVGGAWRAVPRFLRG
jgi:MoaA/NifB/PqqE/SkfB family radical SAM enzyme